MEFKDFMSWAFYGLISFGLYRLDAVMESLKKSVDELKIALVAETAKGENMENIITELKNDIRILYHRTHDLEMNQAANNCKIKKNDV